MKQTNILYNKILEANVLSTINITIEEGKELFLTHSSSEAVQSQVYSIPGKQNIQNLLNLYLKTFPASRV